MLALRGIECSRPGFAMVALIKSGWSLSLAASWWKRLLSAPHASGAAFIEGAAIAWSKNPSEVWAARVARETN